MPVDSVNNSPKVPSDSQDDLQKRQELVFEISQIVQANLSLRSNTLKVLQKFHDTIKKLETDAEWYDFVNGSRNT